MDAKVETFYREILADLSVDREESAELTDFFSKANPPPDKIVWLRAAAFRIGCEFLKDDNRDANVALLRCVNVIVHALEKTCMKPKSLGSEDDIGDDYVSKFEDLYRDVFSDLKVDREESKELIDFFQDMKLPVNKLIWARATAFKIGCEFLSEDKASNVSLLRCINVLIHYLERTYLEPKPYVLRAVPPPTVSVKSIGLNASIEKAVQQLWDLDLNRATPNVDYKINVQSGKKPYQQGDGARLPLFTQVDRSILHRPTYRAFAALLDNYTAKVGVAEVFTSTEKREMTVFLDLIMETAPMQYCHRYCVANSKQNVPSSPREFKRLLYKIWFDLYKRSRNGRPDSSGFEHVFTGEIKNGEVSGFHNWIQFYLEEKRGNLDYYGYIKPRSRSDAPVDSDDRLLTVQFEWSGVMKKVGTMFLGVSPEFEMALYTLCFLMGNESNELDLDVGDEVFGMNIKCFQMSHGKIGTSFPELQYHYEE